MLEMYVVKMTGSRFLGEDERATSLTYPTFRARILLSFLKHFFVTIENRIVLL